jgi:hypothetical protein
MTNEKFQMRNGKWFLLVSVLFLSSCSSNSSQGLAVGRADEGFAIQSLRAIATAQAQFKVTRGAYGDFDALTQAGMLDQRFSDRAPNLKGYRFVMTANESEFVVNADPNTTETQPTTGVRHFYLDSSDNVIHVNLMRAAGKDDPVL